LSDLLLLDGEQVLDPGLPSAICVEAAQKLVTFQRYESTSANRFFRILHELERWQRVRGGERLPAPAVVDISLHAETGTADSILDDSKVLESVSTATGTVDSLPAALEPPKPVPCDEY